MKFSIITPCYNSEKTIARTLECMSKQTFSDYEYIIMDGASTDHTLEIIESFRPQFGEKLRVISEPDKGIYDAMNKGIRCARGELIGIVNSDDWYEPDTLEHIVDAYSGAQYEVIYGMMRVFQDGEEKSIVFNHHNFLELHMIAHPTCFITKDAYTELGTYDDVNYRSSADYELMLRFYQSKKVKFTPVYHILSNFALGGMSSSNLAVIETARLKKSLGLMSTKKYWITVTKARLSDLIGNDWKSR